MYFLFSCKESLSLGITFTHLFHTVNFHIRVILQPLSLLAIGGFGTFLYVAMTTVTDDAQYGRNQC